MKSNLTTVLTLILAAFLFILFPMTAQAQREAPATVGQGSVPRDRERYRDPDPRVNESRDIPTPRMSTLSTNEPDYLLEAFSRIGSRSKNLQKYLNAPANTAAANADEQSLAGISEEIKNFGETAKALKKRVGYNHTLASSSSEANKLLEMGARLDEFVSQKVTDKRAESEWKKIRQDLRVVAHMYGFRQSIFYNAQ